MKLKRKGKPVPPTPPTSPARSDETKKIGGQTHLNAGMFTVAQTATVLAIVIFIIYLVYKAYEAITCYLVARRVQTVIELAHPRTPTVGHTLTLRIRFLKNGGSLVSSDSQLLKSLHERCTVGLATERGGCHDIATVTESSLANNQLIGKVSLRKSGQYEVFVKYMSLKVAHVGEPFTMTVNPGPPCYKKIDFGIHNPNVLCVTDGFRRHFKIAVNDEYGNKCRLDDVDLQNFTFKIFHMGSLLIPSECNFCHHRDTSSLTVEHEDDEAAPIYICLKLKLNEPGVFICALSYNDHEVPYYQGLSKLLICITLKEEAELRKSLTGAGRLIGEALLYSCPCEVVKAGEPEDAPRQQMLAGVSFAGLTFAPYTVSLLLYPTYAFPVNSKTKMILSWSHYTNGDNETYSIFVEDGLRDSIWVEVDALQARSLLLCYAHAQGKTLDNVGATFQEKKKALKQKITPYFPYITWCNPAKIVHVQHGQLLPGSIVAVPKKPEDWLLPFVIKFSDNSKMPVELWLNELCQIFFSESDGLFHKLPGSQLYHPASSTTSRQRLEYYRFCGQILAKCIVEILLRGACVRLSDVKFTKSFLAYMLGFEVIYKFLEADEPNYFRGIRPILEGDLTNGNYVFTTLPTGTSNSATTINLLPNGSDIPVSNENKEHYLNLLAKYRLIHSVEQEISEIRTGFYSVLNKDYLCDFQKDDLQVLMSGGCRFDVQDLKSNYRVITEIENNYVHNPQIRRVATIDPMKLQKWFFTAVQNMSEKERSYLVFFVTGSFSLPACGFQHLNPIFSISLTGTFNQPPKGNVNANEIILSDHVNFDHFESSLLYAIRPESERIDLPQTTTEDRMALYNPLMSNALALLGPPDNGLLAIEYDGGNSTAVMAIQDGRTGGWRDSLAQDPFVNWLKELIHL